MARLYVAFDEIATAPEVVRNWLLATITDGVVKAKEAAAAQLANELKSETAAKKEAPAKEAKKQTTSTKKQAKEETVEDELDLDFGSSEEPTPKKVTVEELTKRAREVIKNDEFRAKLTKFMSDNKWPKMTDVPEDRRHEVLAEMEAYAAVS